jgi:hypothetical protein
VPVLVAAAAGSAPDATARIDDEELPDRVAFTYWAQALFAGDKSIASILATVTAENDAPTANADTVVRGAAGNVFLNDTDTDGVFVNGTLIRANWRAVLVRGPRRGVVSLNANGTFTYTSGSCSADSFDYRINTGTWRDSGLPMSADSNVATVTIDAPCAAPYTLAGVLNVPPATIGTFTRTDPIPMQWRFASGTTVVDSSLAGQSVTVRGPDGGLRTFTPASPGLGSFAYNATARTWTLTLRLNPATDGVGAYEVQIVPTTLGYQPRPPFTIAVR